MRWIFAALGLLGLPCASHAQRQKPIVVVPPAPPPLPEEKYGNWSVIRFNNSYFASTQNDSGSAFGVVCNSSCAFFFNPVIACKEGGKFPALVNSPAGAFSVVLTCRVLNDRRLLSGTIDKTLLDAMEIGGELGVAFPMESGQFRVTRFSLTGALKASLRAYSLSAAGQKEPTEQGLRDQTL